MNGQAATSTNVAALMISGSSVPIGTPGSLGAAWLAPNTSTNSPINLASVNANAGQGIIVFGILGSSRTPAFTDSAGNTYSTPVSVSTSSGVVWMAYCANPLAIVSGTIQMAWSGSSDTPMFGAMQCSGLNLTAPLDVTVTPATGTGISVSPALSITTGQANELIVALTTPNNNAGAYVTDIVDGFANVNKIQQGGGGPLMAVDAQVIPGSAATVSNAPSWANVLAYTALAWTFKGA